MPICREIRHKRHPMIVPDPVFLINLRTLLKIYFFLFTAVVLFTSQVCAADGGRQCALLETGKVMRAAAGVTPARFPNCNDVTVDRKIIEVYHPDGTAVCQDETFTKVLTEKGRGDNSVIRYGFLLPYFTVQVSRLDVIKADGRIVPVDIAANSKESIDNSQMQENIYDPNSRILQVNIPGLQIGDVVHSVMRKTVVRPIIPNKFDDEFVFEGQGYIRHVSCEIRGPATTPLRHFELRDKVDDTVTAISRPGRDDTMVYHWEVNGVPRMYDEPSMPPYETVLQRLLVSTLPDWAAVSRWYWKLSQSHLDATSPEIQQTVAVLTSGAKTDLDKIKAVFYYVSKNIRYMGVTPEKDRPGFEPHDVSLTFAKKYGVCRDKAALLVAMLRIAGLKAYPVLINVGSRLDQKVPAPNFNHAIAAVENEPGRYLLMDPTDEHTRVLLPAYDDNQSYLVCRPEGDTLALSPVTPPGENMMQIRTSGNLRADGTLTATSELSFGGVNGDVYRGTFAEMKAGDRRRFFEKRLQHIMPGTRLTALRISPENTLDESVPLRVEISFSAPAMAAFGDNLAVLSMPWIGHDLGVVNFILSGTGLESRRYPLETQMTCGIDDHISLKMASNFSQAVSIPSASSVDDDCVGYRRHFGFAAHTLDASKDLQLKVVEFSPKQYLELKRTLKDLAYDERKAPVIATIAPPPSASVAPLNPKPEPRIASNAAIVDDRQELTVEDDHTAILRVHYVKRILSYAGKIRESEVKIPYNPATETARIIRAAVISRSGQRQEVSKDEVNVMDAAWNSSAKRYTGGKVLVDSLPGVEIGSTIQVEYEVTMQGRPYLSGFQPFQLQDEIEQKSFKITAPAGLDVRALETGSGNLVSEKKETVDNRQVLQWLAHQVGALPEESSLPPAWSYQAGIAYYVGNPGAYYKKLNEVMLARAARDTRAQEVTRQITARVETKLEAVKAIRDYVAESVRLAGPPFTELPFSELSDADTTLADGYGHAADRAILLHAMLAAVGVHAKFVLAADLPAIAELAGMAQSFPFPDEFKTPLVRIVLDGNTYYLNDTDQYARLGSTRHDNRLGIDLSTGACDTIRAADDCNDKVATTYSLMLDNQGNARIAIRHEYYGMAFGKENRRFSELRPEERVLYFQEAVSGVAQGARPVGGLVTDFNVYPGVKQFEVEVDRYAVASGPCLYFCLPFTPKLFPTETNRRTLPLLIPDFSDEIIRTRIELPPEYRHVAIAPRAARFVGPDGTGTASVLPTTRNGVIIYQLEHRPAIIHPVDYPAAFEVESALENKASRMFLLEKDMAPKKKRLDLTLLAPETEKVLRPSDF
jgi:transglutaminase-like putative cysteine protease